MFDNQWQNNKTEQFQVDEQKILEIFRNYGIVSEKPIDIQSFAKEINSAVYNVVIYSSLTSN
jgi:hypothetical protein